MPDKIDAFESLFKSADKPALEYERIVFRSVVVVTDLDESAAERFALSVRRFLSTVESDRPAWHTLAGGTYDTADALIDGVESRRPDLIVTYRNLHDSDRRPRFSLGTYLDELTQATPVPVLVMPTGADGRPLESKDGAQSVMVLTDHLTGDKLLVDYGARMTAAGRRLILVHIEDERTFRRYLDAIEKIPDIETDVVRDRLRGQLLKEPEDYIESCARVLDEVGLDIAIERVVRFGHRIADCRRLIADRAVDLLVTHTRRGDELAMGGAAYLITAEIRDTPLLLL